MPLDWGQFIRYLEPAVEEAHYNQHEGDWPGPTTHPWLQWTASPPVAADLAFQPGHTGLPGSCLNTHPAGGFFVEGNGDVLHEHEDSATRKLCQIVTAAVCRYWPSMGRA